ncbi:Protein of uncharacterised function (DUF721) [Stutzerimonas stutzeri]|nr:Protein of uncharacterised function (DUF721) [Stutzerimonas stutzeri]
MASILKSNRDQKFGLLLPEIIISLSWKKIACIVAKIQTAVIYWGCFVEYKSERYQKAVNIVDVMEQSSFAKMMRKGLAIHELNQQFTRTFPPQFLGKFRIGAIKGDTLFIEVANAVVRQGILFRQAELLALVQQDYPQVEKFEIRINPAF